MAKKGIKFTEEHKRKLSEAHKGKKMSEEFKKKQSERMKGKKYKLGKKHSKESRERMSKSMKGRIVWNKGKTGIYTKEQLQKMSEIRKGRKLSDETKRKMSESLKGRPSGMLGKHCSSEHKKKISEANRGNKGSNWKGGLVALSQQIRTCYKYRQWRSDVFTRDSFTCQECLDNKGGNLEAHHIEALSVIIFKNNIKTLEDALKCEEVWNINNGQTLCKVCHQKTDNFGGNPLKINQ